MYAQTVAWDMDVQTILCMSNTWYKYNSTLILSCKFMVQPIDFSDMKDNDKILNGQNRNLQFTLVKYWKTLGQVHTDG
jgi:hypothetical protein